MIRGRETGKLDKENTFQQTKTYFTPLCLFVEENDEIVARVSEHRAHIDEVEKNMNTTLVLECQSQYRI